MSPERDSPPEHPKSRSIIRRRLRRALRVITVQTFSSLTRRIVVLNLAGRTVGAVVDAVSDVTALASEQIRPAPALSGSVAATYITALACLGQGESQRMLILLDIGKLMAGELPAGLH